MNRVKTQETLDQTHATNMFSTPLDENTGIQVYLSYSKEPIRIMMTKSHANATQDLGMFQDKNSDDKFRSHDS